MSRLGISLRAILLFLFPLWLVRPLVNLTGARIERGARVGFSLVLVERLYMRHGARIGHLNLLRINRIAMMRNTRIKHLNLARGPLAFDLEAGAIFSSLNRVSRAAEGVSVGEARFRMTPMSGVTSGHYFDVQRSIRLGRYAIVAGSGCQFWTHGYIHDASGPGRYRLDGEIDIGNNVYIGSRVLISLGVKVGDGCVIGAGAVVASDLEAEKMYVSAKLRELPRPSDPALREDLRPEPPLPSGERVFRRLRKS